MKRELRIFFSALMFYTRIPCPDWVGHSEELLGKSTKYFPLIGYIVAGVSVSVLFFSQLALPVSVSIILSILAGILTTGAFHEDGLADVCDGFGGGWSKTGILEIMKDSRIGTYGTIGLVLVLLSRFYLLFELSKISLSYLFMTILVGHTLSRLNAASMILIYDYARENGTGKSKPLAKKMSAGHYTVALISGVIPLAVMTFLWSFHTFFVIIPLLLLLVYLGSYFRRWIGGFTGDCLGSVQQLSEILVYIFMLGLWKFI
ncbi:MAG: adenosylcobinamide-GDP ribazoletransferase [Cytophagales bacterium]|nr:adenosylcobinamide-GDP ribazoletransferase [Cytophagales bacterium]